MNPSDGLLGNRVDDWAWVTLVISADTFEFEADFMLLPLSVRTSACVIVVVDVRFGSEVFLLETSVAEGIHDILRTTFLASASWALVP